MTPNEDYFKSLVCGHSFYERRRWVMLKGFFDDSKADAEGVLVLAGYISNVDGWTAYNKACQSLLDGLPLEEFKMNELGGSDTGMEKALALQAGHRAKRLSANICSFLHCRIERGCGHLPLA